MRTKAKVHAGKGDSEPGTYVLHLELRKAAKLTIGALGKNELGPGRYLYVGSARRGIGARVARHRRLADTKIGKAHWHIDALLTSSPMQTGPGGHAARRRGVHGVPIDWRAERFNRTCSRLWFD